MRTMLPRTCAQCEEAFEVSLGDSNRGRGIYCSSTCQGQAHRSSGNPSYVHGHSTRESESQEYRVWRNARQSGRTQEGFVEFLGS